MTLVDVNPDLAFFVLRLAIGIILLAHGPQKLQAVQKTAKGMDMNPAPIALVGTMETLGALSMILGIWTQVGAVLLGIVMLGAIYMKTQKWSKAFTGENGWELDFAMLAAVITVFLGAPTTYSLM